MTLVCGAPSSAVNCVWWCVFQCRQIRQMHACNCLQLRVATSPYSTHCIAAEQFGAELPCTRSVPRTIPTGSFLAYCADSCPLRIPSHHSAVTPAPAATLRPVGVQWGQSRNDSYNDRIYIPLLLHSVLRSWPPQIPPVASSCLQWCWSTTASYDEGMYVKTHAVRQMQLKLPSPGT
jgi:hypothetical protein